MSSQNLSPSDYANRWCNAIVHEKDDCKKGVDYATSAAVSSTSNQIISHCSDPSITEGFRYGCYLTAAFSGDPTNLCTTSILDGKGESIPFMFPCANTCNTVFGDSGAVKTCTDSAQYQFNKLITGNGQCGTPTFSCINGMSQLGSTYNCSTNPSDQANICLPSVMGCTFGSMQSQMLARVAEYQQSHSQPTVKCQDFMYPNLPSNNNQIQPSYPSQPPNQNPNQNWNPWPLGPTYVQGDGDGGNTGDTHNTNIIN